MNKTTLWILLLITITLNSFSQTGFSQEGLASVYADNHEGKSTASGEKYGFRKATCAHLNLPFGTLLKVTNLENNLSVVLRVNDRGPFVPDRVIQVSKSAAEKLAFLSKGFAKVKIEVVEEDGKSVVMPMAVTDNIKSESTEVVIPNADTSKKLDAKPVEVVTEFYDFKVSKINPTGFTIQIGSFKEQANIFEIADGAKTALKNDIFLQVSLTNGEKIYRLFTGRFASKAEAVKYKEKVSKLYPGCFIVEMKK